MHGRLAFPVLPILQALHLVSNASVAHHITLHLPGPCGAYMYASHKPVQSL